MALISQNFKNDTATTSLDITPVVMLANINDDNTEYEILDLFSTSIINLKDNKGNNFQTKETLETISSVKNSINYETRKLKINTFRFKIKNYHDFKTTLSNSLKYKTTDGGNPANNFIGSYVILFYKTATTNIINVDTIPTIEDEHCSIIFTGVINRESQTDTSFDIQAEDFIQLNIADKMLPSVRITDLTDSMQKALLSTELERVPLVYGMVDRSPLLVTKYHLIADVRPIYGKFDVHKSNQILERDGNVFAKGSNDWLLYDDEEYQNISINTVTADVGSVIPETDNDFHNVRRKNAYGITMPIRVVSNSTGLNSIFQQAYNDVDNYVEENAQVLISNFGYDFVWFRFGPERFNINPNVHSSEYVLNWEDINYSNNTHNHKDGRWILLEFPEEVSMNRILATNFINTYNEQHNPDYINDNGTTLYIKPLDGEQWKHILAQPDVTLEQIFLDENISGTNSPLDEFNASQIGIAVQKRLADGSIVNVPYTNLHRSHLKLAENIEKPVDRLLIFEYFNNGSENSFNVTMNDHPNDPNNEQTHDVTINENQGNGVWKGADIKPLFVEYIQEVEGTELYGCVAGRKDYNSTENLSLINNILEWQELGVNPDTVTLGAIINGLDQTAPQNFDLILDNLETFFTEKDLRPLVYGPPRAAYIAEMQISAYEFIAEGYDGDINWNDLSSGVYNSENLDTLIFNSDDNFILRQIFTIGYIFQYCYRKMMFNVLEKEVREFIQNKIANNEPVYTSEQDYFGQNDAGVNVFLPADAETYDHATMAEDVVGYEEYFNTLRNVMLNIYTSDNENSVLYGLIEEDPNHFVDIWLNNYKEERKALFRRILKFVYVSDLNEDSVDDLFTGYLYEATDLIAYNTLGSPTGVQYWGYYLQQYLDDTIQTINSSIFDHLSTETEGRSELYVWNDDIIPDVNPAFIYNVNPPPLDASEVIELITNYAEIPFLYQTSGLITKPIDIVFDLLKNELKFGANELGGVDLSKYNIPSIEYSREVYSEWQMGFSISEETDGKKLIEELLSETMSYFAFNPEGQFTLVTIKDKYNYDDINVFIDRNDCLKYKFTRTKRENIITHSKMFFRYDNGFETYPMRTGVLKIEDLLTGYDGYNYYNIDEAEGYKEKKLRYHTSRYTVENLYQKQYLLNNCNQHLIAKLELPLVYTHIKISDIIHIPLLNNDRVFGMDYSVVEHLNTQPIYPAWIVTSVDIKLDKVAIEAHQLHYLGVDGLHGFEFPNQTEANIVYANTSRMNTNYPDVHNWNYTYPNPNYDYVQIPEIPYGDFNGNGFINIVDIINVVDHVLGNNIITGDAYNRIANYDYTNKQIIQNGVINVSTLVQLTGMILDNE